MCTSSEISVFTELYGGFVVDEFMSISPPLIISQILTFCLLVGNQVNCVWIQTTDIVPSL